MNYKEIKELVAGKKLPLIGENQDGETVFVTSGVNEMGPYYITRTAQHNDWERVNIYYKEGTIEEYYNK